jgi:hypothetical protein
MVNLGRGLRRIMNAAALPLVFQGWVTSVSRWEFCFVSLRLVPHPRQRLGSRIKRTSFRRPWSPPFKRRRVGQPHLFRSAWGERVGHPSNAQVPSPSPSP